MVKDKSKKLTVPLNVLSVRVYNIAEHTAFCMGLYNYKFYLLAKSVIAAINDNNPLSLANNTRSLVEQIAAITYLIESIEKMMSNLKDQGQLKKIDEILNKAEKNINRVYFGQGKGQSNGTDYKAVHINDSLGSLQKEIPDIHDLYSVLCEYVHPNFGNNKLVSSGQLGKGKFESIDINSESVIEILECSALVFDFLDQKRVYHPAVSARIYNFVEYFFVKGAKITNVFSQNNSKPTGDGKSQKTALFFKKARNAGEAIQLSYLYFSGNNIEIYGRQNEGIEKGYIYDTYNTSNGVFWVKVPMYQSVIADF
ncbi:hypothetical protein AYY20_20590 [Photobacterium aquimaris]|uniref:hypothetical protein n=1 Tax=Photobacterium aquimaris TaxID=512643 RepID=UPI0007EFFA8C|nr:hypothetical protein [Photobacterium aquimaris]OBU15005.1 hypothetical protein AYY20_20590 [Photobacterium aquimaris]